MFSIKLFCDENQFTSKQTEFKNKRFQKIRYYKFLEENRLYYVVVAQIEAKKEKRKL
jgi:hypothetical protein